MCRASGKPSVGAASDQVTADSERWRGAVGGTAFAVPGPKRPSAVRSYLSPVRVQWPSKVERLLSRWFQ